MTTGTGLKKWEVGQTVEVQSRTWAGINREGGCGRIIKIHYSEDGVYVEALDVKYIVSGMTDKNIDPAIVSPFETLERGGRKRRGRDFLMDMVKEGEPLRQREGDENMKPPPSKKKTSGNGKKDKNKKKSSSAISKHQSTKVTGTKKKQHNSSSKVSRNIHPSFAVAAAARQGEADISLLSATTESSSHTTTQNKKKAAATTTTTTTKTNGVKPVPAFVIADREVRVSPLPTHDRLMAMKKNKKNTNNNNGISSSTTTSSSNKPTPGNVTTARRGLFGSSGNNKNKNSTVATATATRAKSQVPRIQHNHEMKSGSKDTGRAIPSSSKANPAPPPVVVSTPPKSSKVLATKVKRAPTVPAQLDSNDGVMIAQKLTKKKKNPNFNYKNNDNDKPILELPRPRQRATGDTNANNNNKSGKIKSLKEVHEDCVKKASNFCNDVIYPSSSIGATAAKENKKNRSTTAAAKKKPPPCLPKKNDEQEEEKQRRLAIFRILRTKAEDGMIEESDFRKVVNSTADTRPFSDDEIHQHLERLYKDEKIMRSDGTLYIID